MPLVHHHRMDQVRLEGAPVMVAPMFLRPIRLVRRQLRDPDHRGVQPFGPGSAALLMADLPGIEPDPAYEGLLTGQQRGRALVRAISNKVLSP
jgi:hypothetical protein